MSCCCLVRPHVAAIWPGIDLLVNDRLVVELKAVREIAPIHTAIVLTYLEATGRRLALLINFKAPQLRDGIRRIVLS